MPENPTYNELQMMLDQATGKVQVAVGAALITTPFWVDILQYTSLIAGAIAAVAGAIIGLHGVYKIFRRSPQ